MFKKIKNEVKVKAVKSHIEKHKWVYVGVAGGILTGAMITYVIFDDGKKDKFGYSLNREGIVRGKRSVYNER